MLVFQTATMARMLALMAEPPLKPTRSKKVSMTEIHARAVGWMKLHVATTWSKSPLCLSVYSHHPNQIKTVPRKTMVTL